MLQGAHRRQPCANSCLDSPVYMGSLAKNITKSGLTTCPYCGVGCGVKTTIANDRIIAVEGNAEHPANFGKLCVKGSSLNETVETKGRLLDPKINGKVTNWADATQAIADKFSDCIEKYGPDSVALYVSGQILTEDYYVANKLAKGYIGTANIDTNSRLCMASAVAGYKRSFGEDIVPCDYSDLEKCNLLVLVGSNAAWAHPILYQRMDAAKKANPSLKVVLIDPRRTATAALADFHLPLEPGSDAALFVGLSRFLVDKGAHDNAFIQNSCNGFDDLESSLGDWNVANVAQFCGLNEAQVTAFYELFLENEKVVTFYSQGVNQSSSGVDKSSAIINCHLLTGRIGKEGMGPFSITGQPNAMGGREVGGLANQLAAHMDIDNPVHRDRVQRFWNSPTIADKQGLKALDLFKKIHEGEVKAVWVIATNPVVSLPDYEYVKAALDKCELLVVSDMTEDTDTAAFADILLPATSWGEKDGTVTNSDRTISRQKGLVPGPGQARHDWQAICEVALKMGFSDGFNYTKPAEIFREHAALSAFENNDERAFDIGALAGILDSEYDDFIPLQWPCKKGGNKESRLFESGEFYHADKKAKLISISPKKPEQELSEEYPFRINSGRMRDQWHTMTRTGIAAKLSDHCEEPFVAMHPKDMESLGIKDGDLVTLKSKFGSVLVRGQESEDQSIGQLFVPIHWNRAFASNANVGALFAWVGDPISGQPESKHGAVIAEKAEQAWGATLCCSEKIDKSILDKVCDYWSFSPVEGGYRYHVSGAENNANYISFWGEIVGEGETLISEYKNPDEIYFAHFLNDSIYALACFSRAQERRIMSLFSELKRDLLIEKKHWSRAVKQENHLRSEGAGRRICSCFGVGENEIKSAIENGINSVDGLGKELKCGTNCGSCIPELNELINCFEVVEV